MKQSEINEEFIRHIALISRIELTDEQISRFGKQFADILSYVDMLKELDTDGVEPMAHALDISNVLADDKVGESLSVEKALANAPARLGNLYKVPKVIGESQ